MHSYEITTEIKKAWDQLYFIMSVMTKIFHTTSNVFGWIYDMVFDQKH